MSYTPKNIVIDVTKQTLSLFEGKNLLKDYSVSTAFLGVGEQKNSFKTPRGLHIIRAKIGKNAPLNAVFVERRQTGEIYSPELAQKFPDRDWILTRILWLSGMEPGKNRLGNYDTMARYIYIHGCPDKAIMGVPGSHGCIRLCNRDMIEIFDLVPVGTKVLINE